MPICRLIITPAASANHAVLRERAINGIRM